MKIYLSYFSRVVYNFYLQDVTLCTAYGFVLARGTGAAGSDEVCQYSVCSRSCIV